jgi:hypothetical protein
MSVIRQLMGTYQRASLIISSCHPAAFYVRQAATEVYDKPGDMRILKCTWTNALQAELYDVTLEEHKWGHTPARITIEKKT